MAIAMGGVTYLGPGKAISAFIQTRHDQLWNTPKRSMDEIERDCVTALECDDLVYALHRIQELKASGAKSEVVAKLGEHLYYAARGNLSQLVNRGEPDLGNLSKALQIYNQASEYFSPSSDFDKNMDGELKSKAAEHFGRPLKYQKYEEARTKLDELVASYGKNGDKEALIEAYTNYKEAANEVCTFTTFDHAADEDLRNQVNHHLCQKPQIIGW